MDQRPEVKDLIQQSDSIDQLMVKVFEVQQKIRRPPKNLRVRYRDTDFRYAGLDAFEDEIKKHCKEVGLVVMQCPLAGEFFMTRLVYQDQWIMMISDLKVARGKNLNQDWGSAITYAARYCISRIFFVSGDDDVDGNIISGAAQENGSTEVKMSFSEARNILFNRIKDLAEENETTPENILVSAGLKNGREDLKKVVDWGSLDFVHKLLDDRYER